MYYIDSLIVTHVSLGFCVMSIIRKSTNTLHTYFFDRNSFPYIDGMTANDIWMTCFISPLV